MAVRRIVFLVIGASALVLCSGLIAAVAGLLRLPTYVDHAQVDAAVTAWRFVSGEAVFHTVGNPAFTAAVYGPLLYVASAPFLILFGASIAASKAAGAAAAVTAVVLVTLHAVRNFGWRPASVAATMVLGTMLAIAPMSFWSRPDPFLLVLVAAALAATGLERRGTWAVAIAIAVCVGLAVNFKAHAFIYFVPLAFAYCARRWYLVWPVMAVVAVAVFLLPFALPAISLPLYLDRLFGTVGGRDLDMGLLLTALRWSLLFLLPPLLALGVAVADGRRPRRADLAYLGVFLLCLAVAVYSASVPGAGWYHLLPLAPVAIDLFLRLGRGQERTVAGTVLCAALALAFFIVSITPQQRLWRNYDRLSEMAAVAGAVRDVLRDNPGATVEMGFGSDVAETYQRTFVRPLLAFAGQTVTVSAVSAMEMRYLGEPAPPAQVRRIAECITDIWLIPTGEQPFAMYSYFDNQPAFWAELRDAFESRYQRTETGPYFDIWTCRTP